MIGEVGSGKTLLCRLLLDRLEQDYTTAYVPNPDLDPTNLRVSLAKELGIRASAKTEAATLQAKIQDKLLACKQAGKSVVLIVDEAQALPDDTLEAIRLLSNIETTQEKLIQIVLFAQPELNNKLQQYRFRQICQRIGFAYQLKPLNYQQVQQYIAHRTKVSGCQQDALFNPSACRLLFKASQGVPRVINILCHKALLVNYGQGDKIVGRYAVRQAIKDSADTLSSLHHKRRRWFWL